MNQYEKMEQILADESVRAQVQTMTNPDDVYELLTEKGLDVPKEAFEEFLVSLGEAVSEQLGEDELSMDSLDDVVGGAGILITVGSVTVKMTAAAAAAFGAGFAVGVGIGVVGLAYLGYRAYKKRK